MSIRREVIRTVLIVGCALVCLPPLAAAQSPHQQNEILLEQIQRTHGLSPGQLQSIRDIFARSGYMGQGNPAVTVHPLTPHG